MVVAASSSTGQMPLSHKTAPRRSSTPIPARPRTPLLPSDSDNNKNGNALPRRPKPRNVPTRVDANPNPAPSSAKRCSSVIYRAGKASPSPSPSPSASSPLSTVQRSQSAERRRPVTPSRVSVSELKIGGSNSSNAQKMLATSSRSLSVSFQGESFSLQVSVDKKKPSVSSSSSPSPIRRAATPERRFPELQQRWPARMRQSLTPIRSSNEIPTFAKPLSPATTSDAESISSSASARSIVIPSRYMSETSVKVRRPFEQTDLLSSKSPIPTETPLSSPRLTTILKGSSSKHTSPNKVRVSPSPTASSPSLRIPSPSKLRSPSSPKPSPSPSSRPVSPIPPNKPRPSSPRVSSPIKSRAIPSPSILTYNSGGKPSDKIIETHLLRMLHNRLLQWRFINARGEAACLLQTMKAEKSLVIAHQKTSSLLESVKTKRKELQSLTHSLKTSSIMKDQLMHLKEYAVLEKEYSSSLSGAVEALRASTLRLPLLGSARADLHMLKDAIVSVVDVMQAMASSVCVLLTKVEELNNQAKEIGKVAAKERCLLNECLSLLSAISSQQVREYGMRIHVLQLSNTPQD